MKKIQINGRLILLMASVVVTNAVLSYAYAEDYIYRDIYSPKTQFVISDRGEVSVGHTAVGVEVCPDDSRVCVVSELFDFYFPENVPNEGGWSYRGCEYSFLSRGRYYFLGREMLLSLIQSKCKAGDEYSYYYSGEAGLIAFGGSVNDKPFLYVVSDHVGFNRVINE